MTRWVASEDGDIYRYRANAKLVAGGPMYSVMGPASCKACGALVWYAHSTTRASFPDGKVVRGMLCWREKGGRVHQCQRPRQKRYNDKRGNRWHEYLHHPG